MKIKEEVGEMPSIHMDESADPGWRIVKLHTANVKGNLFVKSSNISIALKNYKDMISFRRTMRVGKWFDSRD